MATSNITFVSSGTWTCPAGVSSVQVECWGGGAGGHKGKTNEGGAGGGGGAYSIANITIHQGDNYTATVGPTAQKDTDGTASSFYNNACLAAGGRAGTYWPAPTGGQGGQASDGVGTTKYSGGEGASYTSSWVGGGGGEGAGISADGHDADGADPGTGGDGGDGGSGSVGSPTIGENGHTYGGGGGGGAGQLSITDGGAGAAGRVKLTWTVPENVVKNIIVKKASG